MKTKNCHCCGGTGREVDSEALGQKMRSARQKLKLGLNATARCMGISAPYLSDLERGRRNWTEGLAVLFRKSLETLRRQSP